MKIINLEDLETPCLVLDKKLLERNCLKVRNRCLELKTTLRPHVKTSKSVQIIRLALDKKIGPITVSTLQEAEYFASSGFKDILYAVGIVPNKLSRLANIQQLILRLSLLQLLQNILKFLCQKLK